MTNDLALVAEEFGVLKHVGLSEFEPGWTTAIRLQFERGDLTIEADGADDTIRWRTESSGEQDDTAPPAWASVVGSRVQWLWVLTNQRGFRDALQIEFSLNGQSTFVQFLVEAAHLRIYWFGASS